MKITKLLLGVFLVSLSLNLQAQEPAKLKPAIKAPNGKAYPAHWGRPPLRQTRDLRVLPGGYGRGSGTLARWIQENLDKDAKKPGVKPVPAPPIAVDPVAPRPVAPPVFDPNAKDREKSKEQAKEDTAKVQAAIKAWEKAKAESKGNYSYKVSFTSWVGFGNETIIVVENNKVTERRYKSFNRRRPVPAPLPGGVVPPQPEGDSYLEKGAQLGKNKKGASVKTLDELYAIALATAKKPLKEFERRYIRSDKQGLLVSCYIMDRRIADDAPRNGLVVSSITLGKVSTASSNQGGVTRLTAKDNGKTITVKAGQRIEISLAGNPTTGFTWNDKTAGDVLSLSGEVSHRAGGPALGAPGMSTASYLANKAGKAQIVLEYKRVFEQKPPLKTFKVTVAVAKGGTSSTKPVAGNNQARIAELLKEIVRMKVFARRARFTPEGLAKHNAKLAELEKELATLQAGVGKPGNVKVYRAPNGKPFPTHWGAPPLRLTRDLRPFPGGYGQGSGTLAKWIQKNMDADKAKGGGKPQAGNPTFEEWVKGGKKIPAGRVFIGGSPWFNERTGQRRSSEEVYKMLYGNQPVRPKPIRPGGRKPYPAHWGAPPRLQTKDLRPLPGGYGMGSSTLVGWIKKNMDMDAKDPNRGKEGGGKPGANNVEIQKLRGEIARMKDFMKRARFTPDGAARFKARLKKLEDRLAELTKGEVSLQPQGKGVSPAFATKHPQGSYVKGRLLVGMEKGMTQEGVKKTLAGAVPGIKITKSMFNNTILVVKLPDTHNEEQAMAALKGVKGVKYSELDGVVGIAPIRPGGPRGGIGIPQPPPIKLGRPAPQPRR